MPTLSSARFNAQSGIRIAVQVPEPQLQLIIDAVCAVDPLAWGDYDRVTFASSAGTQGFHALGTGRNAASADTVTVPCVELSFFVASDPVPVIEAIYQTHPYEEPVIFVAETHRTLHIRGLDEDNPNRFWNQATPDWVPDEHR